MRLTSYLPIIMLFLSARLFSQSNCSIFDLTATIVQNNPGGCEYWVKLDFEFTGTTNQFKVQGNGIQYGTFTYNQLPLLLGPFQATSVSTVREFVVRDLILNDCQDDVTVNSPVCNTNPVNCQILDLFVDTGDCTSDHTYSVIINFDLLSSSGLDSFDLWANNTFFGTFGLNQLPLSIPNFPWDGGAFDVVKVCVSDLNSPNSCCKSREFLVPHCFPYEDCELSNLYIETDSCNIADSTFGVTLYFAVANPTTVTTFNVTANGTNLGTFNISQLPLHIPNFPWNGNVFQKIKVCAGNLPVCCKERQFQAPLCFDYGPCEVFDLTVSPGICNANNASYKTTINFQATNPGNGQFTVWGNGIQLGTFPLGALPLTLNNVPSNGTANDVIKVCMGSNTPGTVLCCRSKEFEGPDCVTSTCEISELNVTVGDCTSNTTYKVTVNFQVASPTGNQFTVWGNGVQLGTFPLTALPLMITNFPTNGTATDVIKVCMVGTTPNAPPCCRVKEFIGESCNGGTPCEVSELNVTVGDCTSNTTYKVTVNFQVANPTGNQFTVWGNGVQLGTFPLTALPLMITNFPTNGTATDVIKVCMVSTDPNAPPCCRVKEFVGESCNGGTPCEINDLSVNIGDCTSDNTYKVTINFQAINPVSNQFTVWGNGVVLGTFPLTSLPLMITNFPSNGAATDFIKVCMEPNAPGIPGCCKEKDFVGPDCTPIGDCHIYDLHVIRTPCVCGQFFALLSFSYDNVGSGGFDVMGNGVNYGTFPYNTQQPIIIGPLVGDGVTMYEFVVKDHFHADCKDDFNLGKVTCNTPTDIVVQSPGSLQISPNPAADYVMLHAVLNNGFAVGQADLEVLGSDGRLVIQQSVASADHFQLDISILPAGLYRVVLLTGSGRLEGNFVKQ